MQWSPMVSMSATRSTARFSRLLAKRVHETTGDAHRYRFTGR
jgi:hypothetical protein